MAVSRMALSDNIPSLRTFLRADELSKVANGTYAMEAAAKRSLHLSCGSDLYQPGGRYTGAILYECDGDGRFGLNGRRVETGYVFIVNSTDPSTLPRSTQGQVHGAAFKKIFGIEIPEGLVGEGFSITNGKLVDRSLTFNAPPRSPYHDNQNCMNPQTLALLSKLVESWMAGKLKPGRNLPLDAAAPAGHDHTLSPAATVAAVGAGAVLMFGLGAILADMFFEGEGQEQEQKKKKSDQVR